MKKNNRLTWDEIVKAYPDMWVALSDVEYRNNDRINVVSAVVICGMKNADYPNKRLEFMREGKDYFYKRTADTKAFVGVTV